jgi:hypothetical protein
MIRPEIDRHLERNGGFDANREKAIIGGDCADLAKRNPYATYEDVLPTHLKKRTLPVELQTPIQIPIHTASVSATPMPAITIAPAPTQTFNTPTSRTTAQRQVIPPPGALSTANPRSATNLTALLSRNSHSPAANAASASMLHPPE